MAAKDDCAASRARAVFDPSEYPAEDDPDLVAPMSMMEAFDILDREDTAHEVSCDGCHARRVNEGRVRLKRLRVGLREKREEGERVAAMHNAKQSVLTQHARAMLGVPPSLSAPDKAMIESLPVHKVDVRDMYDDVEIYPPARIRSFVAADGTTTRYAPDGTVESITKADGNPGASEPSPDDQTE